ncbi:MAG: DUF4178 domain-containing protein [Gemmatimonadaceae bacterium]
MTERQSGAASCPNCGAPIRFRFVQAVQTTCDFCKSVLVRRGLDLEKVGTQAEFPRTGSPIQLGTEGKWRGRNFTVVGRVTYAWQFGRWNEWHCMMTDGKSAWLSDAQLEYAMTAQIDTPEELLAPNLINVGKTFTFAGIHFQAATITAAVYVGTEGDLPFTTDNRTENWFADLQNSQGALATIDGSERPPLLYVGEYVSFETLELKGLREFDGW